MSKEEKRMPIPTLFLLGYTLVMSTYEIAKKPKKPKKPTEKDILERIIRYGIPKIEKDV